MDEIAHALAALRSSLCQEIDVGALFSRNQIVHRWKAPWRALLLREAVAWRTSDLLHQSHTLLQLEEMLGARILPRSAFETVAMLVYLNQNLCKVVNGRLDYHTFSANTTKLLLGSRDKSTPYESINILSVLEKANDQYPGLVELYAILSESAHPNHEGLILGYARNDKNNFVSKFRNRWREIDAGRHPEMIMLCLQTFHHEYNNVFPAAFEALEAWIEQNDVSLKASKKTEH